MKHSTVAFLALAFALAVSPTVKANTSAGPLTFGSGLPSSADVEYYSGSNVVTLTFAPLYVNAVGTSTSTTEGDSFTFNIAPGWTVSSLTLHGTFDDVPEAPPSSPWAFEFLQRLSLCSSTDQCWSATQSKSNGTTSLAPLSLTGTDGAGQGIYQFSYDVLNDEASSDALPEAVILLDHAHAPEPSSWLLLATGLLALVTFGPRRQPAS